MSTRRYPKMKKVGRKCRKRLFKDNDLVLDLTGNGVDVSLRDISNDENELGVKAISGAKIGKSFPSLGKKGALYSSCFKPGRKISKESREMIENLDGKESTETSGNLDGIWIRPDKTRSAIIQPQQVEPLDLSMKAATEKETPRTKWRRISTQSLHVEPPAQVEPAQVEPAQVEPPQAEPLSVKAPANKSFMWPKELAWDIVYRKEMERLDAGAEILRKERVERERLEADKKESLEERKTSTPKDYDDDGNDTHDVMSPSLLSGLAGDDQVGEIDIGDKTLEMNVNELALHSPNVCDVYNPDAELVYIDTDPPPNSIYEQVIYHNDAIVIKFIVEYCHEYRQIMIDIRVWKVEGGKLLHTKKGVRMPLIRYHRLRGYMAEMSKHLARVVAGVTNVKVDQHIGSTTYLTVTGSDYDDGYIGPRIDLRDWFKFDAYDSSEEMKRTKNGLYFTVGTWGRLCEIDRTLDDHVPQLRETDECYIDHNNCMAMNECRECTPFPTDYSE